MTDEEMAPHLGIPVEAVKRMSERDRAGYENLIKAGMEIELWQAGLGPRPANMIICGPKEIRHGKRTA